MENLVIERFKCFRNIHIPLNGMTLFSGANGNGKSTAIQSLLYLRHTMEQTDGKVGVRVGLNNGYCLTLGDSSQVLTRNSEEDTILLEINGENEKHKSYVKYHAGDNELFLTPVKIEMDNISARSAIFAPEFYYLHAERLGPRIKQEIKFYDFQNTGFQGEFTAQLLGDTAFNYSFKVDEKRKFPKENSPRLLQQVNAWLDYLMSGVSVSVFCSPETFSAQILANNSFTKNAPVIAPNIGFGISYVLPILLTSLIAKEGCFLIVENPEAHLHPSAQSKIGQFLSMVAGAGVRVVVETHSDYVINGMQIAVAQGKISPEKVSINFFSLPENHSNSDQPELETLSVNAKGELSSWPKGFFDQTQIDFAELFNIRKG
jgi:predicted ATPase